MIFIFPPHELPIFDNYRLPPSDQEIQQHYSNECS